MATLNEKAMANQTLIQLRAGIVEEAEFAKYYGHATMDDISHAIRESVKRKNVAAKSQMQQQQVVAQTHAQQQQQMMQQAQQEKNNMLQISLNEAQKDRDAKIEAIQKRGMINLIKQREGIRLKAEAEHMKL